MSFHLEKIKESFQSLVDCMKGIGRPDDKRTWFTQLLRAGRTLYILTQITIREFFSDRLLLRAMALTFVTLLSIIPILAILLNMFNLFGGGEWFMETLRPVLSRNLTPGANPVVVQKIEEILQSGGGYAASGIGLLALILLVYSIFTAIESTFNLIWGVTSRTGPLHRLSIYWGLITLIPILVISSLAFTTYIKALPLVHEAVQRVDYAQTTINQLIPVLMVILSFFLLYRFLPNVKVRTYAALIGAVLAGLIYELFKSGFIMYTGKLVKYDVIYGSMAAIPFLMVWINLSWIIVLLGVEICYVVQYYPQLLHKRKHLKLSRRQEDALAFIILVQATLAFRVERPPVTAHEFSKKRGAPPNIVNAVLNILSKSGIIALTGSQANEVVLKRDPSSITINQVKTILSGENHEEWAWPDEEKWIWMKNWIGETTLTAQEEYTDQTLDDLVAELTAK